jgi:hypothetical protein
VVPSVFQEVTIILLNNYDKTMVVMMMMIPVSIMWYNGITPLKMMRINTTIKNKSNNIDNDDNDTNDQQ